MDSLRRMAGGNQQSYVGAGRGCNGALSTWGPPIFIIPGLGQLGQGRLFAALHAAVYDPGD